MAKDNYKVGGFDSPDDYITALEKAMKEKHQQAAWGIRVPNGDLEKIIKDGRFKTQFETNTSSGMLDPGFRAKSEKTLFGAPINLNPKERPVYGMMMDKSNVYAGSQYGNSIYVKLDKAKVGNRTTVVYSDSLQMRNSISKINDPKIDSLDLGIGDVYNIFEEDGGWFHDLADRYPEIQIHGGVSLDDIDEVLINSDKVNIDQFTSMFKGTGIKYKFINTDQWSSGDFL